MMMFLLQLLVQPLVKRRRAALEWHAVPDWRGPCAFPEAPAAFQQPLPSASQMLPPLQTPSLDDSAAAAVAAVAAAAAAAQRVQY